MVGRGFVKYFITQSNAATPLFLAEWIPQPPGSRRQQDIPPAKGLADGSCG